MVNTVLGPIDVSEMGFTLSHEHLLISSAGLQQAFPEFIPRDSAMADGVRLFREARAEGVQTVVDLTTMDLGRDIRAIEHVARETGVNIIAATGTWLEIPRAFRAADPDDIARLYVREIEEGIEGTGIRAGVIKVANDVGGVTAAGEVILRAAARAHRATGVPIYTHTWAPERVGDQQVRVFRDEGVDLGRVCIGHSNDTTDLSYLTGLLEQGVWLGLDRYPSHHPGVPDWRERTRTAKALIDAGFGGRLMLGHDNSVMLLTRARRDFEQRAAENPDQYLFVSRRALPYLRELGATDAQVRALMVDNPRQYFEVSG